MNTFPAESDCNYKRLSWRWLLPAGSLLPPYTAGNSSIKMFSQSRYLWIPDKICINFTFFLVMNHILYLYHYIVANYAAGLSVVVTSVDCTTVDVSAPDGWKLGYRLDSTQPSARAILPTWQLAARRTTVHIGTWTTTIPAITTQLQEEESFAWKRPMVWLFWVLGAGPSWEVAWVYPPSNHAWSYSPRGHWPETSDQW